MNDDPNLIDVERMLERIKDEPSLTPENALLMYRALVSELAQIRAEVEMLRLRGQF